MKLGFREYWTSAAIVLFVITALGVIGSCATRVNTYKTLYDAEVQIKKYDKTIDTVTIVYFDYIYLDEDILYKKGGVFIEDSVKNYKILNRSKVDM